MTSVLPPVPISSSPDSIYQWALELREYLGEGSPRTRAVQFSPVGLQHRRPLTQPEKASINGVMMWDDSLGRPVVSLNGEWLPVTVESNVDAEFLISQFLDTTGDGTGTNVATGDYSGGGLGATKFKLTSTASVGYDITRMIVHVEDGVGFAASKYGSINGGLTNGILVRIEDGAGGVIKNLTPTAVTTNAFWGSYCYDADVKAWGTGNELLLVRWTFERTGSVVELRGGEELVVLCQDDMTPLVAHGFLVQGIQVDTS